MYNKWFYGTGKKKTAIARVFLKPSINKIIKINNKNFNTIEDKNYEYKLILYPLYLTKTIKKFNINIKVKGGGIKSQILASSLGIARAIIDYNKNYRKILSVNNLLRRDSRIVERKKLGYKKSRKKKQFSKR